MHRAENFRRLALPIISDHKQYRSGDILGESAVSDLSALSAPGERGDRSALDERTPIVNQELHRLAPPLMKHERPGHSLQTRIWSMKPTCGLVETITACSGRIAPHFFAVSAQ